jgi:hypothetical protein
MNDITGMEITEYMKLYTEEELKKAIEMARSSYNLFSTPFIYDKHEVIQQLKSIELPSDEEIDKASGFACWGKPNGDKYSAFNEGAKWMRDKIIGGKK